MISNAERQKTYRERKRAAAERREFERFAADAAFGPSATDEEKYAAFRRHRQTAKADERRRRRAEAARERRKRRKTEAAAADPATAERREEARRRRRAEAAREKYWRDRPERDRERRPRARPNASDPGGGAACSVCDRALSSSSSGRGDDAARRLRACHTCYRVLVDESIPRPSKHQYYQFIRHSMWLEEKDVGDS